MNMNDAVNSNNNKNNNTHCSYKLAWISKVVLSDQITTNDDQTQKQVNVVKDNITNDDDYYVESNYLASSFQANRNEVLTWAYSLCHNGRQY
ncbi:hypothetical protein T09_3720 [Trichinella sp. T9]|nr:hypothetical protein T09_3720 [Trichinella sp. T9]